MGVVNTTYTFTSTDTITSAKMNNIIDDTTFTSDAIQGTTLQVVSPGKLAVSASGITSNELASDSVVTLKIADSNVTTIKIADANVTQAKLAPNVVGNGPAFRAYNSTATSIPTNTPTKVSLGTKNFDTNNNFNTTLSRFTPTVAGYYQINCAVYIFFAPTDLHVQIYKNGSPCCIGSHPFGRNTSSVVSDIIYMNGTTDYIEMYAYHVGTAASTQNDTARTFMSGCLIRSA
jgi:hypothetical protein